MNLLLRVSNYITRYAPSEQKLRDYISRKSHTTDISAFLREIGYSESMMVDMWLRTFLSSSKGVREIREKLRKKGFPKHLIDEKIEENISDIESWDTHKSELESRIDQLLRKGKSKKIITMTLCGKYPYFRDELVELIEGKSDISGLAKEIVRYLPKYDISNYGEKQKFFASLQRKGFGYREIQDFLAKIQE